jgi:hypothetical protein
MFFYKKKMQKKLDDLAKKLENIKINEYVELTNNTKKLLWKNFISGISRGVGIAIGVSLIGALLILLLQKIVLLNIPIIGEFIADLIDVINTKVR